MSKSDLSEVFDKSLAAHASWKSKFKQMLGNELKIDGGNARRADACDFGKWLATSGNALLGASFAPIDAAHKQFHAVVGDAVDAHNTGQGQKVATMLGSSGPFAVASATLTNLLVAARKKAA